jgi:hypothetical protein
MAAPKGNCFNPKGPPEKDVDWKVFEEACQIFCTQEEMQGLLKVDRDTLRKKVQEKYGEDYSAVYKRLSAGGKQSLRRTQFKLAQKNTAMAIWLGKQYLDQKENQPVQIVTQEILSNYEQMINQLRKLQQQPEQAKIEQQPNV